MKIRAGGVMATRSLFQVRAGGSTPTSAHPYKVYQCDFEHIRDIFEQYHYKGSHMGGGILLCYALVNEDDSCHEIVGGAVIGKPRQQKYYEQDGKRVLEIRRMALLDEAPKNSESYFLGKILWLLKKSNYADEVISYADKSVGHIGTIYKAANFKLIGETEPSIHVFWEGKRYHPRSLTIERPYSHRLREALKKGEAEVVKGEPKLIYSYTLRKL